MALGKEFRYAKTFVNKISEYDFDDRKFAMFVVGLPGPVIERVIRLFATIIWSLSNAYHQELYSEHNYDACVKAARMQDAIKHWEF